MKLLQLTRSSSVFTSVWFARVSCVKWRELEVMHRNMRQINMDLSGNLF